ncbi:hypothetical protein ACIG87_24965 [Micromonospora sp. NPDC051925]|uniref:hypothetical protein n=1 Tax=Micromonospora sp. NPDC051925 TaxID=3364288 RepID=UPI0037C5AEA2
MRRVRTVTTTGRWLRLLLLAGTLLGLSAMHTLGHGAHLDGGHPAGHGTSAERPHRASAGMLAAEMPGDVWRVTEVALAVGGCGNGCRAALPDRPSEMPATAWSVCLAVLGALTVALLVLLLVVRTRPAAVARPPSRPREPRAPPPRPFGLRLASVSVLRR